MKHLIAGLVIGLEFGKPGPVLYCGDCDKVLENFSEIEKEHPDKVLDKFWFEIDNHVCNERDICE